MWSQRIPINSEASPPFSLLLPFLLLFWCFQPLQRKTKPQNKSHQTNERKKTKKQVKLCKIGIEINNSKISTPCSVSDSSLQIIVNSFRCGGPHSVNIMYSGTRHLLCNARAWNKKQNPCLIQYHIQIISLPHGFLVPTWWHAKIWDPCKSNWGSRIGLPFHK